MGAIRYPYAELHRILRRRCSSHGLIYCCMSCLRSLACSRLLNLEAELQKRVIGQVRPGFDAAGCGSLGVLVSIWLFLEIKGPLYGCPSNKSLT